MAVDRTPNLHHEHEHSLHRQVPEIQVAEGSAGMTLAAETPPPLAPAPVLDDGAHLHRSFMQCPRCCNCSPGCSHYGGGHFDDDGKYVGPGE